MAKEKNVIIETLGTVLAGIIAMTEDLKGINTEIKALRKENAELKAMLSADNSVVVTEEAPKPTPKKPSTRKKSGTTKKSEKKSETPEFIERLYLQSNRRLETEEFKQVYALVKKHNGKIKNNENKDKDGKRLPLWTFSVDDGKAMVDEVNANAKSIFGRKKMPLEYKIVKVEIKK